MELDRVTISFTSRTASKATFVVAYSSAIYLSIEIREGITHTPAYIASQTRQDTI